MILKCFVLKIVLEKLKQDNVTVAATHILFSKVPTFSETQGQAKAIPATMELQRPFHFVTLAFTWIRLLRIRVV